MNYTVEAQDADLRLDIYLARLTELSRSAVQKKIEEGGITVNGTAVSKKYEVKAGDEISLAEEVPHPIDAQPEDIPLSVVYEDEDLLVVHKPSGMVVHPACGNETGTLVNALLFHCKGQLSGINGAERPGIVHRIDKDTSGLLVVAKNDFAHRGLSAQLEGHHIRRVYHALVQGGFSDDRGTVALPIGRDPRDRKKMAVLPHGGGKTRDAVTHYEVLERFGAVSYLALRLETGRTHQIRVHMAALGHPLLGDSVYSKCNSLFEKQHGHRMDGQCLHAKELSFTHPRTGEAMHFTCELPENFQALLKILRQE